MYGLIQNLIRPFRFRYSVFDLGSRQKYGYERTDSSIINDRGLKIQYSYYKNKNISSVCLVYAHCNSGCRIYGLQFVYPVIYQGWNLCLFDFTGSGLSEGEFISMGFHYCMDLQAIISTVIRYGNNRIHLWGRSMGAATIILYLSETKQIDMISSCVLDSPYCSLWQAVKYIGKSKTKIPEFIIEHLMEYIRKSIMKDHNFDIKYLELLKKMNKIDIPLMFIASTSDSFVHCSHAEQLYKMSNSTQKVLEYIEKYHNSPRYSSTINLGINFIIKVMTYKEKNLKEIQYINKCKKKEQCRKMNGSILAYIITYPLRKMSKNNHHNNNRGKYSKDNIKGNRFCNTLGRNGLKKVHDKVVNPHKPSTANISAIRYPIMSETDEKCVKQNPHTLQHSIIKLVMPPSHFLQNCYGGKNLQNCEREANSKSVTLNPNPSSITLNPSPPHIESSGTGAIWVGENLHRSVDSCMGMAPGRGRRCQSNGGGFKIYAIKSLTSSVDKQNKENKENNLNYCNGGEELEDSYPAVKSGIKNFSSILTKRFNFTIENPLNARFEMNEEENVKVPHYFPFSENNLLSDNFSPQKKTTKGSDDLIRHPKPMGIKLFNKILQKNVNDRNGNKINDKYMYKPRAKTYSACLPTEYEYNLRKKLKIKPKSKKKSENKKNSLFEEYDRKIIPICMISSESDISTEYVFHDVRHWSDSKRSKNQYNFPKYTKNIGNCVDLWAVSTQYGDANFSKIDNEVKHFLSIGDITANNYSQVPGKNTFEVGLNKTQKVVKIQIDRNNFKQKTLAKYNEPIYLGRLSLTKGHYKCIKIGPKQSSSISTNPTMETNPVHSKLRAKGKKTLKISLNEGLDNYFF